MSDAERLEDEAWAKVVRGESEMCVEDMLRTLRIPKKSRGSISVGSDP